MFKNAMSANNISTHIHRKIVEKHAVTPEVQEQQAPLDGTLWKIIRGQVRSKLHAAHEDNRFSGPTSSQLTAFLKSPCPETEGNTNPLALWATLRPGLEHVYEEAMAVLAIPATSTSAERLFSHAGQIAHQYRSRLSPDNLNRRLFLRSIPEKIWFDYQNN